VSGTVVLCGSLGSTAAMWDAQAPALVGSRVVHVEHPGHGHAPLARVASVDDLVDRVLEAVGGVTLSFVGLSLGGAVGLLAAARVPEQVERLVVACTSRRFGEPAQWHERATLVRTEGVAAIVDAVLARWFTPTFHDVGRYRAMFMSVDAEGYARCCEALATWSAGDEVSGIRARTLVVCGAEDPTVPPGQAEELAAAIPNARLAVLDGAAHLANVERSAEFNSLLKEHL
jgi:3-oxoadipate enol-lactonase